MNDLPPKPPPLLDASKLPYNWQPLQVLATHKYNENGSKIAREYIYAVIAKNMDNKVNRIDCYRDSDVFDLIQLYDELFLGSCVTKAKVRLLDNTVVPVKIIGRMDENYLDAGGVTSPVGNDTIVVTLNRATQRETFEDRTKTVSSVRRCYDRLECYQQVIEHELIHVIIRIYRGYSEEEKEGHGPLFMSLAKNIFGITYIYTYLKHDIELYPGRGEKILKHLKKGDPIQLRGKIYGFLGLSQPIVKETPTKIEEEGFVNVEFTDISGGKTTRNVAVAFIKSPPQIANTKPPSKETTILSPISRKSSQTRQQPRKGLYDLPPPSNIINKPPLNVNDIPNGLTWPKFRSYITTRIIYTQSPSELWKEYKRLGKDKL